MPKLTHSFPIHPFSTPWKHQNRKIFWSFQGVEKECTGNRWVKLLSAQNSLNSGAFSIIYCQCTCRWLKRWKQLLSHYSELNLKTREYFKRLQITTECFQKSHEFVLCKLGSSGDKKITHRVGNAVVNCRCSLWRKWKGVYIRR